MPSKTNPFEVLGLAHDSTLDQAKVQFKKLAIRYHPDKVPADQKEIATMKMSLFNAAMDKVREVLENSRRPQPSKTRSEYPKSRANAEAEDHYHKHFLFMYEEFRIPLASLSCRMKANSCSDPAHRAKLDSTRMACDRATSDFIKNKPSSESEVSIWIAHWDQLLEKLTSEVHQATTAFPCLCCNRTDSPDSFDSASTDGLKARALQHQHAKLLHKIEEMSNIIRTRTSSHEIGMPAFNHLSDQLELASKMVRYGDVEVARISTESICLVVEGIRKRVKELERRANARRTMGGQYRPEEVETLNSTINSLISDHLTGQKRSNGKE